MKYCFVYLVLISLCSCKAIDRKIYSPTPINCPSLKQKNDHSFSATFSLPSGFDFNGGYAITNRLAVIGGIYLHKNKDNEEAYSIFSRYSASSSLLYRHKGFHGGAGTYFPLSKTNESFISFFGGYTKGSFQMDEKLIEYFEDSTTSAKKNFYKSDISRYFLQAGLGFYEKKFELSIVTRFNYVGYSDVTTNYDSTDQYHHNLPDIAYPAFSQFLDLGFDSKFFLDNKRRIGLQIFASATARINRRDYNFYHYPFRMGIGIIVRNAFKK